MAKGKRYHRHGDPKKKDETDESWGAVYRSMGICKTEQDEPIPPEIEMFEILENQRDALTEIERELEKMRSASYSSDDTKYMEALVGDISHDLEKDIPNHEKIAEAEELLKDIRQKYIKWENDISHTDFHYETKDNF